MDSLCTHAEHLKDGTEDHGLPVRDGSRRDRGRPSVGNIVGTVVERVHEGKESANGEDICGLVVSMRLGLQQDGNVQVYW